ncbi:MAG TPA: hypothetical protein PLU62_06320 [Ignavibacteriales bacterium]|nr:hypothetical protein [Ignavibacteriales bacterium]HPP33548.1 hypothetical protein [Ignavibacteriales bacterium]
MKKMIIFIIVFNLKLLFGQDAGLGFGLNLGEPIGIGYKYWLDNKSSIDGVLGYSYLKTNGAMDLSIVYNLVNYNYISIYEKKFHFNYGLGLSYSTNFSGDYILGAKANVKLFSYIIESPTDYYLYVSPILGLFPKVNLYMDFGIGVRYYINL